MYNDYDFGGYLIERHIPTFIDGRAVVFGDLFQRYFDVRSYPALFDGVEWLLIRPRLQPPAEQWEKLYSDEIAAVYRKITQ